MRSKITSVLVVLIFIFGLSALLLPGHSAATTGSIYLSPASSSVQVGDNLSVALRITPGTTVNAVQATISYNSSDLQFNSSNVSAFPTCVQNSGGGGTINISCALLGSSVSGDSLISSLSFKALVGSGSASLVLSNANAANSGTFTNPSTANASISFTTPAAPVTPTPSPTPPAASTPSSTPATSSKSSATPTKAQPTPTTPAATPTTPVATPVATPAPKVSITNQVKTAQFNTVTIAVKTSVPVQAYIQYGADKNGLDLATTPTAPSQNNDISLDPSMLTPGTTYYYQVVTKDAAGNLTKGAVQSVTTEGYKVQVTVLDSNYHPVANQEVTLHSTPMVAKTNGAGVATFTNVAPGMHHVEYAATHTKMYSQTVYVANSFTTKGGSEVATTQAGAVVLAGYTRHAGSPWLPILLVLLIAGGAFAAFASKPLRLKLAFIKRMSHHYSLSQIEQFEKLVKEDKKEDDPDKES